MTIKMGEESCMLLLRNLSLPVLKAHWIKDAKLEKLSMCLSGHLDASVTLG